MECVEVFCSWALEAILLPAVVFRFIWNLHWMSNPRSRQCKLDIDYRETGISGKKVPIDRPKPSNITDKKLLEEKRLYELQIFDDIQDIYDTHILDEVDGLEDLEEVLEEISALTKKFRHIHVELKFILGDEYGAAYPEFDKRLEGLRTYTSSVKQKVKRLNSSKVSNEKESLISSLKIEEEVFHERLEKELLAFKLDDLSKTDEIEKKCSKFEHFLEDYYKLFSKAKIGLGVDFEKVFKTKFEELINRINEKIEEGRSKIQTVESDLEEALAKEKVEHENRTRNQFIAEQKFQAKALQTELKNRCDGLVKKCRSDSLKSLTDFQIFDLQKDMVSVDTEMREIFGLVTAFSKIAATCGDEKEDLLKEPEALKDKALKARNAYAKELYAIVGSRDITEEKLKSVSVLDIELGKFQGYDSKTDIYTFKSDFERLIQRKFQKPYWVDTLKKNYLAGPALVLVEKLEDITEIWKKLIDSYGNVKLLLQTKMNALDKMGHLGTIEGDEKLVNAIAKIVNVMTELSTLAEKHNLETKLYVGGGLEKVFKLMGDERERRFLSKHLDKISSSSSSTSESDPPVMEEKETWKGVKAFLEKELNLRTTLTLNQKSKECLGIKTPSKEKKKPPGDQFPQHTYSDPVYPCHICGKTDHVVSTDQKGDKHVDYFACPIFVSMSCQKRKEELMKKGFCFQCLKPGVKHKDPHKCYTKYTCTDPFHKNKKFQKNLHILVCEKHNTCQGNLDLLEEYKRNFIPQRSSDFRDFTKNISLHCIYNFTQVKSPQQTGYSKMLPDVPDSTIFMFQTLDVHGHRIRIFFDSGGTRTVLKKSAADTLVKLGLAKLEVPNSKEIVGVGGNVTMSTHGIYSFNLPLKDGYIATFTGVCLDQVTATFPTYPLREVEDEIREMCRNEGGEKLVNSLPALPNEVGGDIDILIGLTYKKYFPKEVWESPEGLFISDSPFLSEDGTTGVIGGPHAKFTQVQSEGQNVGAMNFFSHFAQTVDSIKYAVPRDAGTIEAAVSKLGVRYDSDAYSSDDELDGSTQLSQIDSRVHVARKPPKCIRRFDEVESACTEILYRCKNCRNCKECKKSLRFDMISIQEEIEDEILDQCVTVDVDKGEAVAKLPFVVDPDTRLKPNDHMARKVYESQVRNLTKKPEDKASAIAFEEKLQELGFVDYFENLTPDQQDKILNAPTRYFIPWFTVWNENSISTPCRLVFDASRCDNLGVSLNNLLAKGVNNINNLVSILIRWRTHKFAWHTDISKMYNRVLLDESHWRFQLYLWDEGLRVGVPPKWKLVNSLIYGVKPSGQLAGIAIRKLAELVKEECPLAYPVILNDIYVDDNLSGANSVKLRNMITDQLALGLSKVKFFLKGFTFSGERPPAHLSSDGVSVGVAGCKWFSEEDEISLKIPDLNFAKRQKGRKSGDDLGKIPEKLSRLDCQSKIAEIYDPSGLLTPITSGFKIDITHFTLRKLDWDDVIPDELRRIWESNFEMM